jgi:hypothetical protein
VRVPVLLAVITLPASIALAQAPPEGVLVGPWLIEVSFTGNGDFDRCIMSRTTVEGLDVRFGRDETGLSLALSSPNWQLEEGAAYPVEFAADDWIWEADVTATTNTVSVALTDETFNQGLRLANVLEIRAAAATLRVPLDGSAAGLARLETCFERNSVAAINNPFVVPAREP